MTMHLNFQRGATKSHFQKQVLSDDDNAVVDDDDVHFYMVEEGGDEYIQDQQTYFMEQSKIILDMLSNRFIS